jgi:hypothetical protein
MGDARGWKSWNHCAAMGSSSDMVHKIPRLEEVTCLFYSSAPRMVSGSEHGSGSSDDERKVEAIAIASAAPAPALGPVVQLTVPVPPIFQRGDPAGVMVDPLWEPHIASPAAESPNIVTVWRDMTPLLTQVLLHLLGLPQEAPLVDANGDPFTTTEQHELTLELERWYHKEHGKPVSIASAWSVPELLRRQVHCLPRQQVQHDSIISVGLLLKSPANYNSFADYFQSHNQYELQDFAQPLHWYWKLWQSGDVTGGAPLPCPILAPSLLQQLPVAPIGLPGDPVLLLVVVVVVVFPLPILLENRKPLASLSLLLRLCLQLHLSLLHCPSQIPSLLRSWLPTVVPTQSEPVQVRLVVDVRPGLWLPAPIPGKCVLPVMQVMMVRPCGRVLPA